MDVPFSPYMLMVDSSGHAELAYWIREKKTATLAMTEAKANAVKWLERAKLAKSAGKDELVEAAGEQLRAAREAYNNAERRAQEAEVQIESSRAASRTMSEEHAIFAENLLLEFEWMGIDVEGGALEQAIQQEELQQTIETLKQNAGIQDDVDPLALLKQRMNES